MDNLQKVAMAFGKTIPEVIVIAIEGKFTTDKLLEEDLIKHTFRRYEEFRVLPKWLEDYCEAILKSRPEELPLWSLAKSYWGGDSNYQGQGCPVWG